MIFKTKLHYIGTSIERLGQVAGAAGPDIRQTRKCVCYYTQVACDTIIGCVRSNTQIACAAILVFVTLERALVYCNFHKRGQVRWLHEMKGKLYIGISRLLLAFYFYLHSTCILLLLAFYFYLHSRWINKAGTLGIQMVTVQKILPHSAPTEELN